MPINPKKVGSSPTPIEGDKLETIVGAISKLDCDDLERYGAWRDLEELSSNTLFEGIEAHPNGVYRTGMNTFEAVANVYVTLQYGGKRDASSMSDSYPAQVSGTISANNEIEIKSIKVDTSSFYK